jgi:hypothetical protein
VASSGTSVHARLPAALQKILHDRGLAEPSGRPLYSYRFTAAEIAALKEPLAQVLTWAGPTCLDTPWCAQAFVAIACHWFCSWRGEGAWGYAPLCAELGLRYSQQDHWQAVASAIRTGLNGWGRRVRRNQRGDLEYLASLICEGGLPLRALQGGRWLYQWLQGALDLVARGIDPRQAATQEAWRAPATFRGDLTPVAAELVERIDELKQDFASCPDRTDLDPVAWLDLTRAGWRDSLPVDMGDDDARALIERVVRRADKDALGGICLLRSLVRARDGLWDFTVSLMFDGHLEHRHLPQELGAKLSGHLRARLKPAGHLLAIVSGDLAILESYEEDDVAWWRVRALRRVKDVPCPPALRIDLVVESDGTPIGNFILPDAEMLTLNPWLSYSARIAKISSIGRARVICDPFFLPHRGRTSANHVAPNSYGWIDPATGCGSGA